MKSIAIVGGYGQMGQMISHFLKNKTNHQITLIDKDSTISDDQYQTFDLVLISVPIDLTIKVIEETAPKLSAQCILCDFTSIKEKPLNSMLDAHKGPVMGLHPMFGPTITETTNQVIVHCPGRKDLNSQWFLDDLINLGFNLKTMPAQTHDHLMNFIQGIEHFSTFCLGSFLNKQAVNLKELLDLASPVYQMELNILGRLFYQSAELYADIIAADEKRIDLLIDYADHIKQAALDLKQGKRQEFIQTFESVRNSMGDFCQKAYKQTDKSLTKSD